MKRLGWESNQVKNNLEEKKKCYPPGRFSSHIGGCGEKGIDRNKSRLCYFWCIVPGSARNATSRACGYARFLRCLAALLADRLGQCSAERKA